MSTFRDATLALFYPQECRVCGAAVESWRDGVACANCWQESLDAKAAGEHCVKCGVRLLPLPAQLQKIERRCGRCDDFAFAIARSCGMYAGALRESVLHLKLSPQLAPRLRERLLASFHEIQQQQSIESLLPVPLHSARQQLRGFNQAEVIARALSNMTGVEADVVSLIREKDTEKHRVGMDVKVRARSLSGAFQVRAPRRIENRAVLLIDDVMTTGSTAHEIARTLLAHGAKSVSALTIARAVTHFL